MFQGKVFRRLIVRIPVSRKIVSADGRSADFEVKADARCEQLPKNSVLIPIFESAQRSPSQFIEAGSEAVDGLKRFLELCLNVPFTLRSQRGRRRIF